MAKIRHIYAVEKDLGIIEKYASDLIHTAPISGKDGVSLLNRTQPFIVIEFI